MKASELRICNFVERLFEGESISCEQCSVRTISDIYQIDCGIESKFQFNPIPLTEEWLLKFGFERLPHFTVNNVIIKRISRGRYISVSCVGTPNEFVFLCDDADLPIVDAIVIRNFDYDGQTYVHQLQNLYFALTGQELTIHDQ